MKPTQSKSNSGVAGPYRRTGAETCNSFGNRRILDRPCFRLALLLVATAVWSSAHARAAAEPADSLARSASVDALVRTAFANNPSIRAARESWRAAVESYRVETGLPDPQLSVTYFPDPIETRLGPQDWNVSITQQLPFPGVLAAAGEIVSADAEIARLTLDKAYRDVVVSLRESYHELQYIRTARQVSSQQGRLLEHLRKVAETAHAADRAALIDVAKAQAQYGQLRYDALLLADLEATEVARINGLLNRDPDAAIGTLEPEPTAALVYTLEEIYGIAEQHQEEIRIAEARIEKAQRKLDLADLKNRPDFRVGFFYAGIGSPDVSSPPPNAGDDAFGVSAGVSLPLWFGKNEGRVARERAGIAAARAEKEMRINETRTQIRSRFFQLENAWRLMDLYQKDLLPQAAKSMQTAETWFRQEETSFSDLIETQAVWHNFQLALARARADAGKQTARLEQLAGRSLTVREAVPSTGKEAK